MSGSGFTFKSAQANPGKFSGRVPFPARFPEAFPERGPGEVSGKQFLIDEELLVNQLINQQFIMYSVEYSRIIIQSFTKKIT